MRSGQHRAPSATSAAWRGGINRRMRADEKEVSVVRLGNIGALPRRFAPPRRVCWRKLLGMLPNLIATSGVNQAVCARHAAATLPVFVECRPPAIAPRPRRRVAERVFRTGDITRACREKGDKSAIRIARNGFNCSMRRGFAHYEGFLAPPEKSNPANGRTSIEDSLAAGWRAAHFQCGIQIRHINDGEAAEKFFRLGVTGRRWTCLLPSRTETVVAVCGDRNPAGRRQRRPQLEVPHRRPSQPLYRQRLLPRSRYSCDP